MTALRIGELVGPYRIIGELGGGGMGMVYRAVHDLLQRPAAVKVLRPEYGDQAVVGDRFLTEARATTAIRHPGIVEVYDYGHTLAGNAYIAMELLEGETLGARLAKRGRLSLSEALVVARRIAAPLVAAHERGIVHRDLKPENIFLVPDPEGGPVECVKILDFGIAKLESATARRTTIGLVLGTPEYMSPEQCRGIACDHRSDLYALGCIVFEMLTGRTPFGGRDTQTLLAAHVVEPAPELEDTMAVPAPVARLVRGLLAKNPGDRPRTTSEVVHGFDDALDDLVVTTRPQRSRTSLRAAILAATGIAISMASIGAWYRSWRTGTRPTIAAPLVSEPTPAASAPVRAIGTEARTVIVDGGVPDAHDFDDEAPTTPIVRKRPRQPITQDGVVIPSLPSERGGVDTTVVDIPAH